MKSFKLPIEIALNDNKVTLKFLHRVFQKLPDNSLKVFWTKTRTLVKQWIIFRKSNDRRLLFFILKSNTSICDECEMFNNCKIPNVKLSSNFKRKSRYLKNLFRKRLEAVQQQYNST